jgi:hypothetical protein
MGKHKNRATHMTTHIGEENIKMGVEDIGWNAMVWRGLDSSGSG